MGRRASSLVSTDVSISREIDTKYDDVKIVADDIDNVIRVANSADNIDTTVPYLADIEVLSSHVEELASVIGMEPEIYALWQIENEIIDVSLSTDQIDALAEPVTLTSINRLYSSAGSIDRLNLLDTANSIDILGDAETSAAIDRLNTLDTAANLDRLAEIGTVAAIDRLNQGDTAVAIDTLGDAQTSTAIDRLNAQGTADSIDRLDQGITASNIDRLAELATVTSIDRLNSGATASAIDTLGDATTSAALDRLHTSIGNIDRVDESIENIDRLNAGTTANSIDVLGDIQTSAAIDRLNVGSTANNIDTLAPHAANIDTVVADIGSVVTVATSIADVNTIADNMSDVEYFADVYQGHKAVVPTLRNDGTVLQTGDLYFDISAADPIDYGMQVHNGTDWVYGYSNAYTKTDSDALHRRVPMRVKATAALARGTLVTLVGYNQGEDAIEVAATAAQTDICIGIVDTAMAIGEFGDIIVRGIIENMDTTGQVIGTVQYSAGSGIVTLTKPLGTYQAVAYIVKDHAVTGAAMINITEPVESYSQGETDILLGTKLDKAGGTIDNDLTITGNLYVNGTEVLVNTETVAVEDNIMTINAGEVGAGVTAGSAGIEIDRGTAVNYEFKYDETDDSFKIGEVGSLQKVATREDTPTDTGIAVYDAANYRFATTRAIDVDSIAVTALGTVDGRDVSVDGAKLDLIDDGAKDDQTPAEILTALKTVDVNGTSGVNAGTYDGLLSTQFLRSDVDDFTNSNISVGEIEIKGSNHTILWGAASAQGLMSWDTGKVYLNALSSTAADMDLGLNPKGAGKVRISNNEVYHAGNIPTWNQDTTGTSNNSDKLDNLDSTQFLRSDEADSTSGDLSIVKSTPTMQLTKTVADSNALYRIGANGDGLGGSGYIGFVGSDERLRLNSYEGAVQIMHNNITVAETTTTGISATTFTGNATSATNAYNSNFKIPGTDSNTYLTVEANLNSWKYINFKTAGGTTEWDIATKGDDLSGALQFRPDGSATNVVSIGTDGHMNVSSLTALTEVNVGDSAHGGSLKLWGTTLGVQSEIHTSSGNLHIDADSLGNGGSSTVYLNYYGGAGGVVFGNGASGNSGASVNSTGRVSGTTFLSSVATGTAPLAVTSTTMVDNLYVKWADTVDVNANQSSQDAWYDVVWHSGDTVYSTANVEIHPLSGTLSAQGINAETELNLGGIQEATIKYNSTDNSIDFIIN